MEIETKEEGSTLTYRLTGAFTFAENQRFRLLLKEAGTSPARHIKVDFSQVDFIDSAALGMLLLLRDMSQQKGKTIELSGASGQIRKMFDLSKFESLFKLS